MEKLKHFTDLQDISLDHDFVDEKSRYEGLKKIEDARKPLPNDFYRSTVRTKYYDAPLLKVSYVEKTLHSKTPKLHIFKNHEMDSYWFYPEISVSKSSKVRIPKGATEISLAEYLSLKRAAN